MARRRREKRKTRNYEGMSDEEWRDWGEKFGKRMAERGEDFGEEMAELGERFGRRMERRGRRWGESGRNWWFRTFGFVGPLIASIVGIVLLAVGIFVLKFVNFILGSAFILALADFLYANIALFFAVFLFTNYNEYFSRRFWKTYWMISPIMTGVSLVVAFWIIAWMITLINIVPKLAVLNTIANLINANLLTLFVVVFALGYIFMFIGKTFFAPFRD